MRSQESECPRLSRKESCQNREKYGLAYVGLDERKYALWLFRACLSIAMEMNHRQSEEAIHDHSNSLGHRKPSVFPLYFGTARVFTGQSSADYTAFFLAFQRHWNMRSCRYCTPSILVDGSHAMICMYIRSTDLPFSTFIGPAKYKRWICAGNVRLTYELVKRWFVCS